MAALARKDYALPDIDVSHDDGDPEWHAAGGRLSVPVTDGLGNVTCYQWTGLPPGHYAGYWRLCVAGPWEETVRAFEAGPGDVYHAWHYVDSHPAFWKLRPWGHGKYPVNHVSYLTFSGALTRGWPEVIPYRTCPETGRHEEDAARNTATTWRYELGPEKLLPEEGCAEPPAWHDYALDGGGATYEEAVIALARAIHEHYGNDRAVIDSPEWARGS